MTAILRLRKDLAADLPPPHWPTGTGPLPLAKADPRALHTVLVDAYANGFGSTPPFDNWWLPLIADTEFDPAMFFIAGDGIGQHIANSIPGAELVVLEM